MCGCFLGDPSLVWNVSLPRSSSCADGCSSALVVEVKLPSRYVLGLTRSAMLYAY